MQFSIIALYRQTSSGTSKSCRCHICLFCFSCSCFLGTSFCFFFFSVVAVGVSVIKKNIIQRNEIKSYKYNAASNEELVSSEIKDEPSMHIMLRYKSCTSCMSDFHMYAVYCPGREVHEMAIKALASFYPVDNRTETPTRKYVFIS